MSWTPAPRSGSIPERHRKGGLFLASLVVLTLLLPGLHTAFAGAASNHGSATEATADAVSGWHAATLDAGSQAEHHAADCPQCQIFAQARILPTPAPQLGVRSDRLTRVIDAREATLPIAAIDAAHPPRAPPSVPLLDA